MIWRAENVGEGKKRAIMKSQISLPNLVGKVRAKTGQAKGSSRSSLLLAQDTYHW